MGTSYAASAKEAAKLIREANKMNSEAIGGIVDQGKLLLAILDGIAEGHQPHRESLTSALNRAIEVGHPNIQMPTSAIWLIGAHLLTIDTNVEKSWASEVTR